MAAQKTQWKEVPSCFDHKKFKWIIYDDESEEWILCTAKPLWRKELAYWYIKPTADTASIPASLVPNWATPDATIAYRTCSPEE